MKLPPLVSRQFARLAFLASLLFALGASPAGVFASIFAFADSSTNVLTDRDENELTDDDVTLHRAPSHHARGAAKAARFPHVTWPVARVPRAFPFIPAERVTRAPPRPPYTPLLRMLC